MAATWLGKRRRGGDATFFFLSYTDPAFLNTYVADAKNAETQFLAYVKGQAAPGPSPSPLQLWMGETAGAGGACANSHTVIGKYVGIFWYADKLGAAAASMHSAVLKQEFTDAVVATEGGGVTVVPVFWASQLWRATMGESVLSVAGDRTGAVRVYAHKNANGDAGVVVINMGSSPAVVNLTVTGDGEADESSMRHRRGHGGSGVAGTGAGARGSHAATSYAAYLLTAYPDPADVGATELALNGQHLVLGDGGTVPSFGKGQQMAGSTVQAPAYSVTFCIF